MLRLQEKYLFQTRILEFFGEGECGVGLSCGYEWVMYVSRSNDKYNVAHAPVENIRTELQVAVCPNSELWSVPGSSLVLRISTAPILRILVYLMNLPRLQILYTLQSFRINVQARIVMHPWYAAHV